MPRRPYANRRFVLQAVSDQNKRWDKPSILPGHITYVESLSGAFLVRLDDAPTIVAEEKTDA